MARKSKKITNDQGPLIEKILSGSLKEQIRAWEDVKHIGHSIIKNNEIRFSIYWEAVKNYDPEKSNNFIKYYMDCLTFSRRDFSRDTFRVTRNPSLQEKLYAFAISPVDPSTITENKLLHLAQWRNY